MEKMRRSEPKINSVKKFLERIGVSNPEEETIVNLLDMVLDLKETAEGVNEVADKDFKEEILKPWIQ